MLKPILQFNPLFVLVFLCASLHAQQTNINVSGGQFSEPYFNFSDENGSINLDTFEFIAGRSYKFTAVQGFSPHPFQIGSSPGTPSQYSSGGPLSSVGDELVLEIPSNFNPYSSSLHFYCTAHTSMSGQLTVVAAGGSEHNNNNDGNNEPGESLDGSVIHVTGEDSVKETLIFENGTVTSIFDEGEGQTPFTTEDLSYSIEDDASGHLVIIDGNLHYLFYESNGTGNLLDYSNNAQLDESGSWGFSYVLYEWEEYDDFNGTELNSGKWGTMYLGGGIEPYVSGGKLRLSGNSGNPSATKVVKSGWEDIFDGDDGGQAWVYPKDSDIMGIEGEFLIPSSASSKSGLQVGVASLNPLSFATAELNAEPNSESQYSQGFGFYHLANNGTEVENFGTTQRDTTHRLGVTLIDGIIKLYVDGEIRYEGLAETFNTDMFFLNGFNDYQQQGLAFELTVDNVRVLRRQGDGADSLIVDEIDGGRDSVYLQTSNGPELIEGAGEFGFDIFLPNEPELSAAELELNGQTYDLTQDDAPFGFRTRYGYGRGEIHELYDIESYSDTDLSSFSDGAEFIFSLSHNGNDYSYTHNIVAESELPAAPNLSINGDANWTTDPSEGHEYLKLAPADYVVASWDSFQADDAYDHINISLQKWVGEDDEDDVFDDEDLVVSADSTSYEFSGDLLEPGQKYTFYVEFVDVTEVSNPEGFRRASQTDDEPILFTYASSITALDMEIVGDGNSPEGGDSILSDSNGNPIVNQEGNEYRWNDTLDGVTIWLVGYDSGELIHATMKYENGQVSGNFELIDEVTNPESSINYFVNDQGNLVWEESNGYQYFQIHSVIDGRIEAIGFMNDSGTADNASEPSEFFFTNRAAAEEFYNLKLNEGETDPINENNQSEYFVPQSIAGGILTAQDENWSVYNEEINFYDNQTFNAVIENDAESPLNASGSYEYSVNSNGSASLFYTVQSDDETNGYSFAYDLVFSASNQGTYTKTANYNGETDITTGPFTLILDSDDGGSGTGHQNDGNESEDHNDEFTPIEEVEEFVNELKNSIEELTYSDAVWVEKKHDALVDGRFVYEVGLNNMINLYFDQNGSYIHAAEDYMEERQFIPKSEISQSIKDLILAEVPNSEIIDFEVEFSRINVSGNDNKIFFAVIENNQSESFEVVINGDGERVIIVMPFEDIIPWRPVELPEVAVEYLADNYVYDDGYPMNYWEDQRPTPDGNSMEFVAYLEDGREVIFDEDGSFNREFDPWNIEEDAKLSFNPKRSAWGMILARVIFRKIQQEGMIQPMYILKNLTYLVRTMDPKESSNIRVPKTGTT